jgi:hypothetical protein
VINGLSKQIAQKTCSFSMNNLTSVVIINDAGIKESTRQPHVQELYKHVHEHDLTRNNNLQLDYMCQPILFLGASWG